MEILCSGCGKAMEATGFTCHTDYTCEECNRKVVVPSLYDLPKEDMYDNEVENLIRNAFDKRMTS